MKQHITKQDLNQLSDKAKEKLRGLWTFKSGDLIQCKNGGSMFLAEGNWHIFKAFQGEVYPLSSIGQLIEFINETGNIMICSGNIGKHWHESDKKWHIAVPESDAQIINPRDFINSDELCDALFAVVKDILESKDEKN